MYKLPATVALFALGLAACGGGGGDTSSGSPAATPPVLAIATSSLGAETIGSSYNTSLTATGGTAPYAWSVTSGSLPASAACMQRRPFTPDSAASNSASRQLR